MKYQILIILLAAATISFGQKSKKESFKLTNALVVGQVDSQEDRYSLEINMTQVLVANGIKAKPSLNIMKIGSDSKVLASDSIQTILKNEGIDTYMVVSVRGYDRKFKVANKQPSLEETLSTAGLFELYRMDIVSVSIEYKFYQNNEFVFGDMIKCGNVGDREDVLKKLRKKVSKRSAKKWR